MSTSTSHHISVREKFKGLLATGRQPAVLSPVLHTVVQASSAFVPLQSAAKGLLRAMKRVEVRPFSSQSCNISVAARFCWTENDPRCGRPRRLEQVFLQPRYYTPGTT